MNLLINDLTARNQLIAKSTLNVWNGVLHVGTMINSATALDAVAWDDVNKVWVAIGHTSTHLAVSLNNGGTWVSPGETPSFGIGTQYNAIGPHPTGSGWSLLPGGSGNVFWSDVQTNLTDTGTNLGVGSGQGGIAAPLARGSCAVGVIYDNATGQKNAKFYQTFGTSDGTLVTNLTSSLPTAWKNANSFTNCKYFTWTPGPAQDIFLSFGGSVPGTDASKLGRIFWTGTVASLQDIAIPSTLSNKSIVGIAWNDTLQLLGAMCYDGSHSYLYTSADLGNTWTLQAQPAAEAGGLAVVGPYWVTSIRFPLAPATHWRAYISSDGDNFEAVASDWGFSGVSDVPQKLSASWTGTGPAGAVATSVVMWSQNGAQASLRYA